MDDERKARFRTWLEEDDAYDPDKKSANTYISDIELVESRLKVNVDEEFAKDQMVTLLNRFERKRHDVETYRLFLEEMKIINPNVSTLRSYKSSVNHYKVFRDQIRNKIFFWIILFMLILVVLFGWTTQ